MSGISNAMVKNLLKGAELVWSGSSSTVNFSALTTPYNASHAYLVKIQGQNTGIGDFALMLPNDDSLAMGVNASYTFFTSGFSVLNVEKTTTSFSGYVIAYFYGKASGIKNSRVLLEVWDLGETPLL